VIPQVAVLGLEFPLRQMVADAHRNELRLAGQR
jgi:hypothetical protein